MTHAFDLILIFVIRLFILVSLSLSLVLSPSPHLFCGFVSSPSAYPFL
jgi:hypothetical protein